jgi:hypothetical protein
MVLETEPSSQRNLSSSVKLRRKNRANLQNGDFKNRYSGGDFLLGQATRPQNGLGGPRASGLMQLQQPQPMRKSGDWSYVSFPAAASASKSPAVTPKLGPKRPLSLMQTASEDVCQQPISLLETKVMASIIHNESKRGQRVSSEMLF